ncbi:MAG: peptidoglycan-binding protein [Pedosphaera sp.]|nr:peptidoglycan-binding protein [Pedosphaera sp.]
MNNSNPFVPQGSLLEQKNKKRARVKVAVYTIFALNILVLTPLLIQGCSSKKDANADSSTTASTQPPDTGAPVDTNPPPLPPMTSNTVPSMASNAVPVPPPQPIPQPPITPEVPATHEYVVAKGDSYYTISKKLGVKMKDIEAANPGIPPTKLKVGQKLQVPAGGSSSVASGTSTVGADGSDSTIYVVKAGDSLTKIATAHGLKVKALKAANELKSDKIKAGQKLKIPAKSATAAVDTSTPPVTPTVTSAPPPLPVSSAPSTTAH